MRVLCGLVLFVLAAGASQDVVERAKALYETTNYESSLRVLAQDTSPDGDTYLLTGKNYFMMDDYKRSIDYFQKAVAASPQSSDAQLWLGRAWGRKAETSGWFTAGMYAVRARQSFEKAIALDPHDGEAKNDLFDFYLNAPGFLGGGIDKAEALAKSIIHERPAEYEFEEAQLADRRKDYAAAEAHLRRAMELQPDSPGRVLDVAKYVAKRGRFEESDRLFERARKMAPKRAGIVFAEARTDIDNHRRLDHARSLLEDYLHASLTPDDPPRKEAEKLLRRLGG